MTFACVYQTPIEPNGTNEWNNPGCYMYDMTATMLDKYKNSFG